MSVFFSVITVSKDNLSGLRATAQSLAAQTCRDFEWIVVDGGSRDGSVEFLRETDANWRSEADNGIYDAMNKGIPRAKGEYLIFLNAGDLLADADSLQAIKSAAKAQQNKPDFIYGDALESQGGQYFAKPAHAASAASLHMFTHHQAMLYRRAAIDDLRYHTRYQIAADYDFTMRFLESAAMLYIPRPICIFEAGGISQQKTKLGRQEQFEIRENLRLCGAVTNKFIRTKQAGAQVLRRAAPNLYWHLRAIRR